MTGLPGHRDDRQVRLRFAQLHHDLDAVFFRHHEIRDHEVGPLALEALHGFLAVARGLNLIPGERQRCRDDVPHGLLVVHDQNVCHDMKISVTLRLNRRGGGGPVRGVRRLRRLSGSRASLSSGAGPPVQRGGRRQNLVTPARGRMGNLLL